MLYAIIEVAVFLLVAMLVGVLVGWLLFRAGRRTVPVEEWDRLERERHRLRNERDAVIGDQEILLADRDRAFAERDAVLEERDLVESELGTVLGQMRALQAERAELLTERNYWSPMPVDMEVTDSALTSLPLAADPAMNGAAGVTRSDLSDWGRLSAGVGTEAGYDDLQQLPGIGPEVQALLHREGIRTFRQIADLDEFGIDDLQARLPEIPGRIRSHDWVSQARILARRSWSG